MKKHLRNLTRANAGPAMAFGPDDAAKYLGTFLDLAGSFLSTAAMWQSLQAGKSGAQN